MGLMDGLMEIFIKEIGMKIKFLVMVNIFGMMEEVTRVNGKIILCMEKDSINGPMDDHMRVNM